MVVYVGPISKALYYLKSVFRIIFAGHQAETRRD